MGITAAPSLPGTIRPHASFRHGAVKKIPSGKSPSISIPSGPSMVSINGCYLQQCLPTLPRCSSFRGCCRVGPFAGAGRAAEPFLQQRGVGRGRSIVLSNEVAVEAPMRTSHTPAPLEARRGAVKSNFPAGRQAAKGRPTRVTCRHWRMVCSSPMVLRGQPRGVLLRARACETRVELHGNH